MAFLRKMSNVVLYGLPLFLSAALQIRGVFGLHICALEIAGKNLLEILLAIDRVSGQVIEPSSGRVSQIDGEKLNDKQVAICPARPSGEVVVL
jgi:small neutral amino acid transporter SnatA (MarC family)